MTFTLDPPKNPSFDYTERELARVLPGGEHTGYESDTPLGLRPLRQIELQFRGLSETHVDYFRSFHAALAGTNGPFFWKPLDKIPSPEFFGSTLDEVSGGSLGARTYSVQYSWYDASSETKPSPATSFDASANNLIRITAPPVPAGAIGFRAYLDGALQASIQGRTWTEPSGGAVAGAAPPSTNTLRPTRKWRLVGGMDPTRFRPGRWNLTMQLKEVLI